MTDEAFEVKVLTNGDIEVTGDFNAADLDQVLLRANAGDLLSPPPQEDWESADDPHGFRAAIKNNTERIQKAVRTKNIYALR